jgi:acyl-CoA synthetase (AMP-forming)/AMP-acid ligase II
VDQESGAECSAGQIGLLEAKVGRVGGDWIRTTDLARLDKDGFLYLEGRADEAINRGGFKILPEQVTSVLREHPAVGDVAVVGLPDRRLGQVPVAVIVRRSGARAVSEAELTQHCRRHLLAYQVPARFRFAEELPRTGTLKIDRRRVLELFTDEEGASGPPA